MLQTVRAEKVDQKEVICLVFMLPSRVIVLKWSKKVNFLQFCAKNLSLLKQFTYMDLKVLVTVFQKMIWYIGV